jgi:Ca2+-binding EF-hand superfamily protein
VYILFKLFFCLFIKVVIEHLFQGEQMNEEEMQDIFDWMDTNKDGQIDAQEAYNAATQFESTG